MDNYFNQLMNNNSELIDIFNDGINSGAIQCFDSYILSRLRRVYYSCISGILYLLGEPNGNSTLGNKLQLLAHVLRDEDYTIVHGITRSSQSNNLKIASWIEVKKNNKVWVYDILSMLKFERNYFEALESPIEDRRVPKYVIISHPAHDDEEFRFDNVPMLILFFLERYESNTNNPFYKALRGEIKKYKANINYSEVMREYHEELKSMKLIKSDRDV